MKADRRREQKQSYNHIMTQSQNNDIKVSTQTEEVTSIRQSVQEIFSEDNIKAIKLGLKAQIEANMSVISKPKEREREKIANESQILNLTALQRSEISPQTDRILEPMTNRTHLTRASSVEQIEYKNQPQTTLPPMDYQRFGNDQDRRKLLLKGLRADVAAKRDKLASDDVAKMNRMIQANEKIQKELSKKALPFDDIFPMLKEFTTREDEKKQRRLARVREIIKLKGESSSFKLPKLDQADLITIHMNSKRLKRSESVLRTGRERLSDASRLISITSCIDRGNQDTLNSPKKLSLNESLIEEHLDSKNQKDSIISGIRPLLRGGSVADSGFSQMETERDLRYYSVMEVPKNKKDRPTKVSFMLNSNLLGLQTESQGASTFITANEEPKSRFNKPTVIEQSDMLLKKKSSNSRFITSYKERSFLNSVDFYGEEGRKVLLRHNSAPRFL